jgi:hypothetical protein
VLGIDAAHLGEIVLQGRDAADGVWPTGIHPEQVLHCGRHAGEHAEVLTSRQPGFEGLGRGTGFVEGGVDEGVDDRVAGFDARDAPSSTSVGEILMPFTWRAISAAVITSKEGLDMGF